MLIVYVGVWIGFYLSVPATILQLYFSILFAASFLCLFSHIAKRRVNKCLTRKKPLSAFSMWKELNLN